MFGCSDWIIEVNGVETSCIDSMGHMRICELEGDFIEKIKFPSILGFSILIQLVGRSCGWIPFQTYWARFAGLSFQDVHILFDMQIYKSFVAKMLFFFKTLSWT